jgi:peptide-methionine (R)-S-oxide reductase
MSFPIQKTDEEWRRILTPEQYAVLREHDTERPGSCALLQEKRPGTFTCAGCGQAVFVADRKFESGTGWPSFFAPLPGAIAETTDSSYGMVRTEVHCSQCGGHLGHVFSDGPPPTGLRYCINGVALNFAPKT